MKTLSVLLLQCLATLATASAPQAFIYTHDVQPRPSSPLPDSVSSDTAYSIWARRLGLSEQRRLTGVDDTILNQIDQFGGHRAPLFGKPHSQIEPSRLSIAIEGYNDGAARLEQSPELTVGKPLQELADALTSFKLWNGRDDTIKIVSRTQENIKIRIELAFKESCDGACQAAFTHSDFSNDRREGHIHRVLTFLNLDLLSSAALGNKIQLASMHLDYTKVTGISRHETSKMIHHLLSEIHLRLDGLAATGLQESTVIILPSITKSLTSGSKQIHQARRSQEDNFHFAAEEEPTPSSETFHFADDMSGDEEEALSISEGIHFDTIKASNSSNSTAPIRLGPGKFLPLCFSSADACANGTNSCSGHGACYQKRTKCFACRCSSTIVRHNDDGTTKSVKWGGTACEKKDISVEFWLFAGFGVIMTSLVAGGIGMLYSMGAEELPSVIGAGVAGPRAQK